MKEGDRNSETPEGKCRSFGEGLLSNANRTDIFLRRKPEIGKWTENGWIS